VRSIGQALLWALFKPACCPLWSNDRLMFQDLVMARRVVSTDGCDIRSSIGQQNRRDWSLKLGTFLLRASGRSSTDWHKFFSHTQTNRFLLTCLGCNAFLLLVRSHSLNVILLECRNCTEPLSWSDVALGSANFLFFDVASDYNTSSVHREAWISRPNCRHWRVHRVNVIQSVTRASTPSYAVSPPLMTAAIWGQLSWDTSSCHWSDLSQSIKLYICKCFSWNRNTYFI